MFINSNCLFCQIDHAIEYGACKFCNSILPWITKVKYKCAKCQKLLTFEEQNKQTFNQDCCQNCQENINKFNKIFAVFSYQAPIKNLILALKFNQKLIYGDFLGKILTTLVINNWYQNTNLPSIIIPVPLHVDRLRVRGFNQAFELSKNVAKTANITINNTDCVRTKNTFNQAKLLKKNRNINTKHAFMASKLPHKHIAIVDDVVTTGNTIKSLCNAILQQNPNIIIDVWCICRA